MEQHLSTDQVCVDEHIKGESTSAHQELTNNLHAQRMYVDKSFLSKV